MIVEAKHHHFVIADKFVFGCPNRVIVFLEIFYSVQMTVESWFMSNDQVQTFCRSALKHIVCGHHGCSNACDGSIGIACFDCVNRLISPRNTNFFLDLLN